jgi:hypothetical protein
MTAFILSRSRAIRSRFKRSSVHNRLVQHVSCRASYASRGPQPSLPLSPHCCFLPSSAMAASKEERSAQETINNWVSLAQCLSLYSTIRDHICRERS